MILSSKTLALLPFAGYLGFLGLPQETVDDSWGQLQLEAVTADIQTHIEELRGQKFPFACASRTDGRRGVDSLRKKTHRGD